MASRLGVVRAEASKASFNALPEAARQVADGLVTRLATLVKKFPERTCSNDQDAMVYRHPDPLIELTYWLDETKGAYVVSHFAAPLPPRVLLFISYSHKDNKFREEFCKYANKLHTNGYLSFWHDKTDIEPGEDWEKAIRTAMGRSQGAVLLVTQDFLTSSFIRKTEMPTLLDRHEKNEMKIYWVHVAPSMLKTDYPKIYALQAMADPEKPLTILSKPKREQAWVKIAEALHERIEQAQ